MTKMTKIAELTEEFKLEYPQTVEFLTKLENKGIKFELGLKKNEFGDEMNDYEIGINTYDWIWSWFTIYKVDSKEWANFRGSYSMNTGKTKKGIRRQVKVVTELHRQLNIVDGNGYDLF